MRRQTEILGFVMLILSGNAGRMLSQVPDRGIVEVGSASSARGLAPERAGFYASIGVGDGRESYRYSDEPDYTPTLSKPTLSLRLGGTPNARARVGGELFTWRNPIDGGYESFTTYMMTGQFFLSRRDGLSIRGGAGFARSGTSYDDGESVYETGFGFSGGLGWDVRMGRNFFITPTIDWYSGSFTKRDEPTITERVLNIGVQLTLQTGSKR